MNYIDLLNNLFKMVMLIFAITTSIELLNIQKKTNFEKLLLITTCLSILDITSNYIFIDYLKSENNFKIFASINQYVFYLFEILTFIFFYNNLISPKKNLKNTLIIILLSFLFTIAIFIFSKIDSTFFTFTLVVVFELIYINFSFGYFLTLNFEEEYLTKTKKLNLINYGLFMFINITTPFYFVSIYLNKQQNISPDLSFINHIGYTILYFSIIKSLRWKI